MTKLKGNIEAIYGLSPMQEGILFHTVHAPESGLYFEQYSCLLEGSFDTAAFERAWQLAADRHPALRSLFTWEGRPKPLQIVRQKVTLPWTHEDWRELSPSEQEERLTRHLEADRSRGFALDRAPLIRLGLFRTADDATRFGWSFHHLLLDGWSMRLVLDEVLRSYESIRLGSAPPVPRPRPYRDYIAWLKQQNTGDAEAFWKRRLDGFTDPTPLPGLTIPRSSPWAERHLTEEIRLDSEATSSLRSLARQHRLTLNTLVRGAWALLLSRYSGEDDIVFGATVSGRPAELTGVQEMVGLFINTLPVRVDTSQGFELCPADACNVADAFCPAGDTPQDKFSIIKDFAESDEGRRLIAAYEPFLASNQVEVAGIEFIRDGAGEIFTYDINTNTNYNAEAENKAGVTLTGMRAIAQFLVSELLKTRSSFKDVVAAE